MKISFLKFKNQDVRQNYAVLSFSNVYSEAGIWDIDSIQISIGTRILLLDIKSQGTSQNLVKVLVGNYKETRGDRKRVLNISDLRISIIKYLFQSYQKN